MMIESLLCFFEEPFLHLQAKGLDCLILSGTEYLSYAFLQ